VNDTYDVESTSTEQYIGGMNGIFLASGTNIEAGKKLYAQMHGFGGYSKTKRPAPYEVTINHPEIFGAQLH